MNKRLQELLIWSVQHEIDLDKSQIDMRDQGIVFYQYRETRENFRAVKRAISGFEKKGDPPYINLEKKVEITYTVNGEEITDRWKIKWSGAYKCNISYDCVAENFEDDDEDIEDFQLEKAGLVP